MHTRIARDVLFLFVQVKGTSQKRRNNYYFSTCILRAFQFYADDVLLMCWWRQKNPRLRAILEPLIFTVALLSTFFVRIFQVIVRFALKFLSSAANCYYFCAGEWDERLNAANCWTQTSRRILETTNCNQLESSANKVEVQRNCSQSVE